MLGGVHQDLTSLKNVFCFTPILLFIFNQGKSRKIQAKERIKSWLDARLLQKDSIPSSTRYIVWMDFTYICYPYNHLVVNLHNECSFCASPLLKEIPDNILKYARVAYTWDTTEYTPTLTGVPPHVLLMSEMEILR